MVLGNTFSLAICRIVLEMVSFCLLFLMLNKPKFSWKKTISIYILYSLFVTAVGMIWVFADIQSFKQYSTLVLFIMSIIFFPLMSRDGLFQTLHNLSLQVFVLLFQIVLCTGLSLYFFNKNPWIDLFLRLIYLAVLVYIYARFFRKAYREIAEELPQKWVSITILSLFGNLLIIYYATQPKILFYRGAREIVVFTCIWIILFITHLTMIRTLVFMRKQMQEKQEKELATVSSHLLGQQLSMMEESVEEARRIRHDMRHHNMQIVQYVQKGSTDELLHYLGEYEEKAESHAAVTICDNTAADNILNAYLKKAKQHGIAVRLDVTLEKNIGISGIDLVAMLANLMENAIHGCIHSGKPEPFIELYIGRKASKLIIYTKNTAAEDIVFENGIPLSSRGEGIGVTSILHSAAAYGGEYDFQMTDGVFSCQLLLKTPKTLSSKSY